MEELPSETPAPERKEMRVRVRLRETQPYRLQYGLFYDTDRGVGGLVEAQHLNLLGRATNLGLRLRYDSDLKEGRLYYHQPFVTRLHLKMDASAFWQQETRSFFSAKRIGFSLMQERELPREFRLDYGYRYDHVRWNGLPPDPILFQASDPVARLTGTLTRDTRDSVLDPTRGEFTSQTFEFGPRWLGSEVGFARYSGQYFRYLPLDKYLGKPIVDRKGEPLPTNFVYAAALRLGLTSPFGKKSLIAPERFFAGGGTTMRGFEQDLMGPVEEQPDGSLRPSGGEAMFLLNNELRFPIVGILQGVAFLDIGNVYRKLTDFDFTLRKTAGAGLRLKIRSIPLRFDYGFKLDRKTGESGGEFFFSIGQAF
jgi:outer membrane protein assembly factor BamA